jgi:hypothetical protein
MTEPNFVDGIDSTTFAPFVLEDCRATEYKDVRLAFHDHDWTREHIGGEYVGAVYLNGYGIQALVLAARVNAGLDAHPDGMVDDSEADTCNLHFNDVAAAVETAALVRAMIHSPTLRARCAELAEEHGLNDS